MNLAGLALDRVEEFVVHRFDPECHPAGHDHPRTAISTHVTVSGKPPEFTYHLPHTQLGLGASFGNDSTWIETKGTGSMLNLFSIPLGRRVFGGMSLSYMLPFADFTFAGPRPRPEAHSLSRSLPSQQGEIHLHPVFQQREFLIGDGLSVLETYYVPRTGEDDICGACTTIFLCNSTPRPISLSVIVSAALRGETPRDMQAAYSESSKCLLAWNKSHPEWVRVLGASHAPDAYLASTDEERACRPRVPLPNEIQGSGDLVGALQFDVFLLPGKTKKISCLSGFSDKGKSEARALLRRWVKQKDLLRSSIEYHVCRVSRSSLHCPDPLIAQGIAWAKACLLRTMARYPVGLASTNDPGRSSNIVGRDSAWLVYGADYFLPGASRSVLRILAAAQREDGLIPEFVNGLTGATEDHGFNINDGTALFLMAAGHHFRCVRDSEFIEGLLPSMIKAGELVLSQTDERGLVVCTAQGTGADGICGWRNVLGNEQINGAVTEANAECYAALMSLAEICEAAGQDENERRYREAAGKLRAAINTHLIDPETGLYIRNIDLEGNRFTQPTIDMVFPLFCGVAEDNTRRVVCERLSEPDFASEGGFRSLPQSSPNYDPSEESGCLGGVWPGATWWLAMGKVETEPDSVAHWLRTSYRHYLQDPLTFSTVPGQFSEWSDGETLVNRGMRLSPWEPPRFLWVAMEGLAGIRVDMDQIRISPAMPAEWKWMAVSDAPIAGQDLSYAVIRRGAKLEIFTANQVGFEGECHVYEKMLEAPETLVSGVLTMAFSSQDEILILLASSLEDTVSSPFLAHHLLDSSHTYRVEGLISPDEEWRDHGMAEGANDQRINVRLEPQGYALLRFKRIEA